MGFPGGSNGEESACNVVLQPGRAETRTCPIAGGWGKLRLPDYPRKHAKGTFLRRGMLPAPIHCLPLHPFAWKENKIFPINSRPCANQTPQYRYP